MTTDPQSDDHPSEPDKGRRPMFGPTPEEHAQFIREIERDKKKLARIARDMEKIARDGAI